MAASQLKNNKTVPPSVVSPENISPVSVSHYRIFAWTYIVPAGQVDGIVPADPEDINMFLFRPI